MCVGPVAKCPAARVASQPPSVDSSNDCGKNRSVMPCAASWASSRGPLAPAWMRAERDDPVDLQHAVEPPEVERHRAGVAGAGHRVDAADDARPAAVGRDGEVRRRRTTRARARARSR